MHDLRLRSVESVDRTFPLAIAENYFGIQATAEELPSERDRNFLLTARGGERFVLKIANANENRETLEAQNALISHLSERVAFCPRVVPALSGEKIVTVETHMVLGDKHRVRVEKHLVRVLSYLPGKPLATVTHSPELLYDLGRKLGQLSRALIGFDHPGAHRDFHWDLIHGLSVLQKHGPQIRASWLRKLVCGYKADYQVKHLRKSVIHGDANDYNVLVDLEKVVGLIDFGDIVYSYTVGDLAIAIAYVVLGKEDPHAAAAPVIEGYREKFELNEEELASLWPLVRLRLCMSVCLAAYQQQQQPKNEYLSISQKLIAETLPRVLQ
jgi:Ser/Thr protein kinase RdoA (MazF antagonist)